MSIFKNISLVILTMLVFLSCKKEYSLESTHGTFKDSTNSYLDYKVNGSYEPDIPLTISNFVVLTVNVLKLGNSKVTIKSNTVNGYSFSGSAFFDRTGIQEVKLYGSGTPIRTSQNSFIVYFDTSVCPLVVAVKGNSTQGFIDFDVDGEYHHFTTNSRANYTFSAFTNFLNLSASSNNKSLMLSTGGYGGVVPGILNSDNTNALVCEGIFSISNYPQTNKWMGGMGLPSSVIISIDHISYTRVSGTFRGIFKDNDGLGPGSKIISNGVYDLPIY